MGGIDTRPISPTKLTLTMNEPDTAATGVLTSDNTNPTELDTVTIGDIIYTFMDALSTGPTVPYEVLIGADANATLANLRAAINGLAGEGTTYGEGTVAHPDVTCGAVDTGAHTITVTANEAGLAGNSIAKAESSSHLDWDGAGATLTGGDINDIDSIAFGSSGFVKKLIVVAPDISGTPTFVLRILDKDGVVILESSALNDNAISYVDVGFVLVEDDVIQLDLNADLTELETFSIIAR